MAGWRSCSTASAAATRTCARSGFARAMMPSAMLAVMLAAMGVFGTGTGWPDVIVPRSWAALACGADGRSSVRHGASFAANAPRRLAWRRSRRQDMGMTEQPPVVCSLSTDEYQSRIAWIEDLTLRALQSHVRDDLVLLLSYAPEAAPEVRARSRRHSSRARARMGERLPSCAHAEWASGPTGACLLRKIGFAPGLRAAYVAKRSTDDDA